MKECWRDGDLRAFLDGELAPAEMERLKAHLAGCHGCEARYDEIAGRANLVSGLLESLGEMEAAGRKPRPVAAPAFAWRRWAGAAAALAAGVALAAMLLPGHGKVPVPPEPRVAIAPPPETAEPEAPAPVPAVRSAAAGMKPAVPTSPARPVRRRELPRDVFLALDDEPIETGMVVRMTLGEEQIPADVIFGRDGRARAVRLISNPKVH